MNLSKHLGKKNVIGYSETTQKRLKEGKEVDENVIRIYVSNKEPISTLSAKDEIPDKINGKLTDVVEIGDVTAQCFDKQESPKSHRDKWRPAVGGVSIGHGDITAGTLGVPLFDRNDNVVVLSNNHVLGNSNDATVGDKIYQPGPMDNTFGFGARIGTLHDYVKISWTGNNHQDSATGLVDQDDVKIGYIDGIGQVDQFNLDIANNMQVKTSGRTPPEISEGRLTDTQATLSVNYGDNRATFVDQILSTPISSGGDSGSAIVDIKNRIIGLLFAGSSNVTVINKIKYPKEAYGLKFN